MPALLGLFMGHHVLLTCQGHVCASSSSLGQVLQAAAPSSAPSLCLPLLFPPSL